MNKNLITEARELIEALHAGEYDDEYIGTDAYLMLDELCDALEKAEAEAKALNDCNQKLAEQNRRLIWRKWIPVTEDIPPYGDEVLVMHSGVVDIAVMDEVNAFTGMFTHWMPLPAPPEEGAEHE